MSTGKIRHDGAQGCRVRKEGHAHGARTAAKEGSQHVKGVGEPTFVRIRPHRPEYQGVPDSASPSAGCVT